MSKGGRNQLNLQRRKARREHVVIKRQPPVAAEIRVSDQTSKGGRGERRTEGGLKRDTNLGFSIRVKA